jgi:Family of unknown function (DUF6350)
MSHLLVENLARSADKPRAPWLVALSASGWSVVAGLALCIAPVLAGWLAGGVEQSMAAPLQLAARLWLVAHHTPVELPMGTISFMPWGLSLPLGLLTYGAARWAARVSGVPHAPATLRLTAAIVGPYALIGSAIALAATSDEAYIDPRLAALGTGLVALVSAGTGVLVESGMGARAWASVPTRPQTWLRAGAIATAVLITGGGVLVVVALGVHAGRIGPLTTSLDAGIVGGLLITLLGVVLIPNAVVWATAYALGPGFAVGAGSAVSPGEIRLGPLPGLPILAGLPAETQGVLGWLVVAIPLAAGLAAGLVLHRAADDRAAWARVLDTAMAGAFAGAIVGVLAAVCSGSVGPGRLAQVGAPPLPTALSAAAEIAVVATVTVLALRWRSRRTLTLAEPAV